MNFLAKLLNIVLNLPVVYKLSILFFVAHLDERLRESHSKLSAKLQSKLAKSSSLLNRYKAINSSIINKDEKNYSPLSVPGDESTSGSSKNKHKDFLPELWQGRTKIYRRFTNIVHPINFVKFLIIWLILDRKLLPLEWNCFLWGRPSMVGALVDYTPLLSVLLSIQILLWRYIVLKGGYHFELDLIVFLSHDDKTISRELNILHKLTRVTQKYATSNPGPHHDNDELARVFPMNVLQRALIYKFDYGQRTIFKLRPNRTERSRLKMKTFIDTLTIVSLLYAILTLLFIIPILSHSVIFDILYIRNYPLCCPLLEQLANEGSLSFWQITLDQCSIRRFTIPFDILDNVMLRFESAVVVLMPMVICLMLTQDLLIHWKAIDVEIKNLAYRYRERQYRNQPDVERLIAIPGDHLVRNKVIWPPPQMPRRRQFEYLSQNDADCIYFTPVSTNLDRQYRSEKSGPFAWGESTTGSGYWAQYGHKVDDFDVANLQALIVDFFENFRRANRFMGLLVSFTIFMFAGFVVMFAFTTMRIPNLWGLWISKCGALIIFTAFVSSSILLLSLKRNVDRSYPEICSLMALDRSSRALKWIRIADSYIYKSGTAITIFQQVKFTWHLVFNLAASSISFLVAIETYKLYSETKLN